MRELRQLLESCNSTIRIIAKIEHQEGVSNLADILAARLLTPSWFSILAMIRILELQLSSSWRSSRTSAAVRTKLAAM